MSQKKVSADPRTEAASVLQCLVFHVAGEVFAIDIRHVREIIKYAGMTVVPNMPAFLRGVVNLRGSVVPVVDINARLFGERAPVGKRSTVIIMQVTAEGARVDIGLFVDAVSEVIAFAQSAIETSPQFGNTIPRDFILGLGKQDNTFVVILDPEKVFDIESMALLIEQSY
jgi:purine-binding chemotaxis protein CheW